MSDSILSGVYFSINTCDGHRHGLLALSFMYFPSGYTVAAIFGPRIGGWCSVVWGIIMSFLATMEVYLTLPWYIVYMLWLQGGIKTILGVVLIYQQWGKKETQKSGGTWGSVAQNIFLKF